MIVISSDQDQDGWSNQQIMFMVLACDVMRDVREFPTGKGVVARIKSCISYRQVV